MRRNVLTATCLSLSLFTAACQDQKPDPTSPSESVPEAITQGIRLERGKIRLPDSYRVTDRLLDATRRAINPGDFVCTSTLIDVFYNDAVDTWEAEEPETFELLYNQLLADFVPTFDALLFQTEDTPQYFGYNGEYTHIMRKTERDIKRFWDIRSNDIQLIGMHGTMLLDVDRVAAVYASGVFGPIPAPVARQIAEIVVATVEDSEVLNGGNHPILSFNAFALTDEDGFIPDKIVMGDGILDAYKSLGFDDVAPQAIFAHEFAHHIQFENDYFSDPLALPGGEPENTRYTELMADAYAAYFLTHKRGAAMNQKRVKQFLQVFFQIGDCAFTNPGHHGTPNQRMRAAEFGFRLADKAQKQGHILTSEQFHDLFVDAYPAMVAPDAP
jgi:hypothetical protein